MDQTEVVFIPTYKKKLGKTKLILCLIAILAIGLFWYQSIQANPPLYGVAIFQSGGIGSEDATPLAYILKDLNSSEVGSKLTPVEDYVSIYFKNQKEMWASCAEGYRVIDAGSSTKNPMHNKPTTESPQAEVGIEILDQADNALQIACGGL